MYRESRLGLEDVNNLDLQHRIHTIVEHLADHYVAGQPLAYIVQRVVGHVGHVGFVDLGESGISIPGYRGKIDSFFILYNNYIIQRIVLCDNYKTLIIRRNYYIILYAYNIPGRIPYLRF